MSDDKRRLRVVIHRTTERVTPRDASLTVATRTELLCIVTVSTGRLARIRGRRMAGEDASWVIRSACRRARRVRSMAGKAILTHVARRTRSGASFRLWRVALTECFGVRCRYRSLD